MSEQTWPAPTVADGVRSDVVGADGRLSDEALPFLYYRKCRALLMHRARLGVRRDLEVACKLTFGDETDLAALNAEYVLMFLSISGPGDTVP